MINPAPATGWTGPRPTYAGPVIPVFFAAMSAAVWGAADFSGGKASQRADPIGVTVVSQVLGLPVLVLAVSSWGHGSPRPAVLAWGALAGVAGFIGIVLLYRGLSMGSMAVFAPTTAMTAAVVPLVFGLVADRTPPHLALLGAVIAVVAIGLVSVKPAGGAPAPDAQGRRRGAYLVGLALLAGLMFGIFFVVLGRAGDSAGMWPLVGVRAGSIGAGLIVAAATRVPLRFQPGIRGWTVSAGVLDTLANTLYVVAATTGPLSIVAPVGALYPVSTVLLALGVDRERVHPVQLAGLGLAAAALVLAAA